MHLKILLFTAFLSFTSICFANQCPLLDGFAAEVVTALKHEPFETGRFCSSTWSPKSQPICNNAIPWQALNRSEAKVKRAITLSQNSGIVTVWAGFPALFSAVCSDRKWTIDLDDVDTWKQYALSRNWFRANSSPLPMYFASKPEADVVTSLVSAVQYANQFLSLKLASTMSTPVNLFFLNARSSALDLGYEWSGEWQGGFARPSFMQLTGPITHIPNVKANILHEMVHEFTLFNKNWPQGESMFANGFLAEGIAVWLAALGTNPSDLGAEDRIDALAGIKKAVAIVDEGTSVLKLFDNTEFRKLQRLDGMPGYKLAAGVFFVIENRLGLKNIKPLWSKFVKAKNDDELRKVVAESLAVDSDTLDELVKTELLLWAERIGS